MKVLSTQLSLLFYRMFLGGSCFRWLKNVFQLATELHIIAFLDSLPKVGVRRPQSTVCDIPTISKHLIQTPLEIIQTITLKSFKTSYSDSIVYNLHRSVDIDAQMLFNQIEIFYMP